MAKSMVGYMMQVQCNWQVLDYGSCNRWMDSQSVAVGNISWNDVVVISGCGPLGLGMVAGARKKDPKCIVALDMMDWKLDVAKKCGADIVLNPSKCNLIDEIMKITEDLGCDVYIEATGAGSSVKQGLNILARLGRFVEYSVFGREVTCDWSIISKNIF